MTRPNSEKTGKADSKLSNGELDIGLIRSQTKGCQHCNHMNNAGASLMPDIVVRTLLEHINLEAKFGGYEAANLQRKEIAGVYDEIARLVSADRSNIAIVENSTVGFSLALSSIEFTPGDIILTSNNDYVSNQIMFLSLAKRFGAKVVRVAESDEGGLDIDSLKSLIQKEKPRLVAITHVPTNSGLIQSVEKIGRICRTNDILYLVDACQSIGQMPVNVDEIGCDFLVASSRKFLRGPRGLGFMFVADRVLESGFEPMFPDLRGARWTHPNQYAPNPIAARFENWEFPYALVLATGAAAKYANELGVEAIQHRCRDLSERLRQALSTIPGVRLLDYGQELCAIVSVAFDGLEQEYVTSIFRSAGINVSVSVPEYALIDLESKGANWSLRISPHYFNTEFEIDAVVQLVESICCSAGR